MVSQQLTSTSSFTCPARAAWITDLPKPHRLGWATWSDRSKFSGASSSRAHWPPRAVRSSVGVYLQT